jgi:hypothetical protein
VLASLPTSLQRVSGRCGFFLILYRTTLIGTAVCVCARQLWCIHYYRNECGRRRLESELEGRFIKNVDWNGISTLVLCTRLPSHVARSFPSPKCFACYLKIEDMCESPLYTSRNKIDRFFPPLIRTPVVYIDDSKHFFDKPRLKKKKSLRAWESDKKKRNDVRRTAFETLSRTQTREYTHARNNMLN